MPLDESLILCVLCSDILAFIWSTMAHSCDICTALLEAPGPKAHFVVTIHVGLVATK